jgi:PAS domain S-box-containing protein
MQITFMALAFAIYQRRSMIAHIRVSASEQRLNYALDATSEGIWDWNLATGRIDYSTHWLRMMGYSAEEAERLGDLRKAIVHPEDSGRVQETLDACLRNETPLYECEARMRTRDGSYRHILDRGRVVELDGRGSALRMVGTFTDITLRKEMEESISKKEDQYRKIIENATDLIYEMDSTGHLIFMNPAFKTLTGYEVEEFLGRSYLDIIPEYHQEEIIRKSGIQFVKKTPTVYYETPIITKDGRELWFWQNVSLVLDRGEVTGFHVYARDITERKLAEHEIRKKEEQYRQLVENASDLIYETDANGFFTFLNPATEKVCGYRSEELMGRHFLEFIPEAHHHEISRRTGIQFVKKTPTIYYETPIIKKDGTEIWIWQSVSIVFDGDTVTGWSLRAHNRENRIEAP